MLCLREKIPDIHVSCFLCGENSTQQYSVSCGVDRSYGRSGQVTLKPGYLRPVHIISFSSNYTSFSTMTLGAQACARFFPHWSCFLLTQAGAAIALSYMFSFQINVRWRVVVVTRNYFHLTALGSIPGGYAHYMKVIMTVPPRRALFEHRVRSEGSLFLNSP